MANKRPKNLRFTPKALLSYLGRHKLLLALVAVLVAVSALANLLGTYMIRPVVNSLVSGRVEDLIGGVVLTAAIYGLGVLCTYGYTQVMVRAAQKVLLDIRRDLFAHLQRLPLRFFDTRRHGDVMSYFTNDVDTISEALNNSFAMVIQSFIQMAGTLVLLFVLNWQLSLVALVCYTAMLLYIRFSGKRSKAYFSRHQKYLGDLDGYIQEMVSGQKVVKVFNHEEENLKAFREKNEALRREGIGQDDRTAPFRLAHEGTLNDGCFDNGFFYEAFHEFDNQSIEKSLVSKNPLVRILALLDRRLGKRRLLALEESMEQELDWVRAFYVIRMQAEGLMEKE